MCCTMTLLPKPYNHIYPWGQSWQCGIKSNSWQKVVPSVAGTKQQTRGTPFIYLVFYSVLSNLASQPCARALGCGKVFDKISAGTTAVIIIIIKGREEWTQIGEGSKGSFPGKNLTSITFRSV